MMRLENLSLVTVATTNSSFLRFKLSKEIQLHFSALWKNQ